MSWGHVVMQCEFTTADVPNVALRLVVVASFAAVISLLGATTLSGSQESAKIRALFHHQKLVLIFPPRAQHHTPLGRTQCSPDWSAGGCHLTVWIHWPQHPRQGNVTQFVLYLCSQEISAAMFFNVVGLCSRSL